MRHKITVHNTFNTIIIHDFTVKVKKMRGEEQKNIFFVGVLLTFSTKYDTIIRKACEENE